MIGNERPMNPLTHQLNQYIVQQQSEVGRSGKTLHQLIADFLDLKSKNPGLTEDLDEFHLSDVEQTSAAQYQKNIELLQKLQRCQSAALSGYNTIEDHPWYGFAYFEQDIADSDQFLRTIRFVAIQLNKFWVEVQSIPLFLNGLPRLAVKDIEAIFQWVQTCPSWREAVQQPRVIPALTIPDSRKVLFDFVRDVKCARILQERICQQLSSEFMNPNLIQTGYQLLTQAVELVQRYQLGSGTQADLVAKSEDAKNRVFRSQKVQEFFRQVSLEIGFTPPQRPQEAQQLFKSIECLRVVPRELLQWRNPRILGASQRIRIQAWHDRARPVLEARKKLNAFFKLELISQSERLRDIAANLISGGFFRKFHSPYREAVKLYKSFLRPDGNAPSNANPANKESRLQMSERLLEWANYLEQVQFFENNSDLRSVFGSLSRGLDTDFTLALEANTWATQIRNLFDTVDPALSNGSETIENPYSRKLIEVIFNCSESAIDKVLVLADQSEAEIVASLRGEPAYAQDRSFLEIECELKSQLNDLNSLLNILIRLGMSSEVFLISLENVRLMTEELIFLTGRMDTNTEIKQWLRTAFRGIETDLTIIEQGLGYVQFMENADIPEPLRLSFLSLHGPQRLEETRNLMNNALSSLSSVHEHLEKLEIATHGQIHPAVQGPIPDLMTKLQNALKQPALLHGWLEYLQVEQAVRTHGLSEFLTFLHERSAYRVPFELAYEIVYNSSLLKKAFAESVQA